MPGRRLTEVERAQIEVLFGQGLTFPPDRGGDRPGSQTVWREVTPERVSGWAGRRATVRGRRIRAGRGGAAAGPGWCVRAEVMQHRYAQREPDSGPGGRGRASCARPRRSRSRRCGSGWPKLVLRWSPRADRPVAARGVSRPAGAVGVPRDDLPGDLLPGPRRDAHRAGPAGRAALRAGGAAPAVRGAAAGRGTRAWVAGLPHLHPPGRSRRPGGARALGRRPDHRRPRRQRDHHPGRAGHPLRDARRPAELAGSATKSSPC